MTKWAFVDYENVGTLKSWKLSGYGRLIVFCGPQNHRVTLDPDWSGELSLLKVRSTGSNNLDFHLVLHLGRHHETADPTIEFHVFSRDHGFDGVLSHLRTLGRTCRRIADPPVPKQPPGLPGETARLLIDFLNRATAAKWPSTRPKALNAFRSHLRLSHPNLDAEAVFDELLGAGLVKLNGARLAWNEAGIRRVAGPPLGKAA